MSRYDAPSFVNCHLSVLSFHLIATLSEEPRLTSNPAFSLGVPVTSLLRTKILSAIDTLVVSIDEAVPCTVKLPTIVVLPPTVRLPEISAAPFISALPFISISVAVKSISASAPKDYIVAVP